MGRKLLLALVMALVLSSVAVVASANGHTADQLEKAGWFCVNAGPSNWVHCFTPQFEPDAESLSVKVFSEDGNTFLGTELLLRADLYHGQPCPQDGGGEYDLLPASVSGLAADYRACHHFDTGH